ncbi:MAG: aquaporin [Opitutales bacterium]
MRAKLAIEAFATFFLCLACLMTSGSAAPLMVAATLCALVYMGGAVSGAHYNPAVSIAILLRGRTDWRTCRGYVAVQFAAAAAAGLLRGLLADFDPDRAGALAAAMSTSAFEGFLAVAVAETLGTCLLAFVVLMVATSRLTAGNGYHGLAVALTVLGVAGMFSFVQPDLNPAVTFAQQCVQGPASALVSEQSVLADLGREWAFLAKVFPRVLAQFACQLLGAALAAGLFLRVFPEDR